MKQRIVAFMLSIPLILFCIFDFSDVVLKYRKPTEDYSPQIGLIQQILDNKELKPANILVLGSSSTLFFFGQGEPTNRSLSNTCSSDIHVFNASTARQSLSASIALIDLYRKKVGDPGIIVMGLTARRLSEPNQSNPGDRNLLVLPVPVSSSSFADGRLPEYFLSRFKDKIARFDSVAPLVGPRSEWKLETRVQNDHKGNRSDQVSSRTRKPPPILPLSVRAMVGAIRLDQIANNFRNDGFKNVEWLKLALSNAAGDVPIVFLMSPVSPVSSNFSYPESDSADMQRAIRDLKKWGELWDLRNAENLGLSDSDFRDEQHIRDEGRAKLWSSEFAFGSRLCEFFPSSMGEVN